MRRTATIGVALLAVAALGACIPAGDRPYDGPPPPPSRRPPPQYRPSRGDDADRTDPGRDRPGEPPRYRDRGDASDRPSRPEGPVTTLPAPRPAWEARPVSPDARDVAGSTYVVRSGDTLRQVAERTGAGSEAIARANGLDAPFVIRAGQQLDIPAGRYHLVRPGESGIAIARAYGVEWSRIVAANALVEPYVLRAGQRVVIPDTAAPGRSGAAERAAAFRLDIDDILTGGEPALATNAVPAKPASTAARVLPTTAVVVPPARLGGGGFVWPVDGKLVRRFGPGASGERNDGVKIAIPVNTPIHAAADGVVAYVGSGIAALGGLVIVRHGGGWTSVYGHAAKLLVQRGQAVKRGQTIALSGDTGFADRPEVHFELRKGRTPVDPTTQLPRL